MGKGAAYFAVVRKTDKGFETMKCAIVDFLDHTPPDDGLRLLKMKTNGHMTVT